MREQNFGNFTILIVRGGEIEDLPPSFHKPHLWAVLLDLRPVVPPLGPKSVFKGKTGKARAKERKKGDRSTCYKNDR